MGMEKRVRARRGKHPGKTGGVGGAGKAMTLLNKITPCLWFTDGGQESQRGWFRDRFGLSWPIFPEELNTLLEDPDPERSHRAARAVLIARRVANGT